jgi:hypothetical protein
MNSYYTHTLSYSNSITYSNNYRRTEIPRLNQVYFLSKILKSLRKKKLTDQVIQHRSSRVINVNLSLIQNLRLIYLQVSRYYISH